MLEGTDDGFWELDLAGGSAFYSERFARMFGYVPEEIGRKPDAWQHLVHEEDLPGVLQAFARHLRGETGQFSSLHRKRRRDGGWLWVQSRARVVRRDPAGRAVCIAGADSDVTARVEREAKLHMRATVFGHSGEAIFITDVRRRILTVNPAFTSITGYAEDEVVGREPALLGAEEADETFTAMFETQDEAGHWQGEVQARRRDGEVFPLWLAVTASRDAGGKVRHYIAVGSDISERKTAEQRLQYLAHHDVLTGLPNRVLLRDRLEQVLAHARRTKGRTAVLFMDLDRFKLVNDSLGHHTGDELLRLVAGRLRACVRMEDTISRQGGDEFLLVLGEVHGPEDAARVARKIGEAIARPFFIEGKEIRITSSIGVAMAPDDGDDGDTLVRNADAAMYHAKQRGRNNFQLFASQANERMFGRLSMENNLRRAVDRGGFMLHFQPQVDVRTSALTGVEALLRWPTSSGLIYPMQFIGLAEETGLILPIGEWVAQEACRQQRAWNARGMPATPLAINLSAVQFRRKESLARLRAIVAATCARPQLLEMELTESAIMEDADSSISALRTLRELGVTLAIDDFGTGYSSLSYLRRFPVNRIKVDRSFVRDLSTDATDRAITGAIIGLGRSLNLKVTAEGVEHAEEIALLRERHCDELQGYYFAPPLPEEAFMDWWRAHLAQRGGS